MTTSVEAPTHLLCILGPLTLGFEALRVREVMALPQITPLSEAAPLVAGAVNLRGRVVPLLDLRAALGLEITPPTAGENLVVLEDAQQTIAVRVDEVRDVQQLDSSGAQITESTNGIELFVSGLARDGAHIVQLVNLSALFEAAAAPTRALQFDAQTGGAANWRSPWFSPAPADREILRARAQTLARPLETARGASANISVGVANGERTMPLAAATLNGELFGFDLNMVREFAPLRSLTRVPLGPESLLGLLNLRGEILPLLDIRGALGMETPTSLQPGAQADDDRRSLMEVVVVEHGEQRVAIWVEQVLDVFAADNARFRAATPGELLSGSVPYGARMLAVLNVPAILSEIARVA